VIHSRCCWWGLIGSSPSIIIFCDFKPVLIDHWSFNTSSFLINLLTGNWRQDFWLVYSLLLRIDAVCISYYECASVLLWRGTLWWILPAYLRFEAVRLAQSLLLVAQLLLIFKKWWRLIPWTPHRVYLLLCRYHGIICLSILRLWWMLHLYHLPLNCKFLIVKRWACHGLFDRGLREGLVRPHVLEVSREIRWVVFIIDLRLLVPSYLINLRVEVFRLNRLFRFEVDRSWALWRMIVFGARCGHENILLLQCLWFV